VVNIVTKIWNELLEEVVSAPSVKCTVRRQYQDMTAERGWVQVGAGNLKMSAPNRKALSTPSTTSKQHCQMLQVKRFFRQNRTLLRHCCWCGRGLTIQVAKERSQITP